MIEKDKWIDISHEVNRTYVWEDDQFIQINKPIALMVTDNGHRVKTADYQYYIRHTWNYLVFDGEWVV